jgi:hypothetical protein
MALIQPNRPEKRSAIEKIMQGLQVAQAVYGIKSTHDQYKLNQMRMKEAEEEQRRDQGVFTQKEAESQYRVGADSPLYSQAEEGKIEGTGETFKYIPEKKLQKIKIGQSITEDMQKSQLDAEYRLGRVRPTEIQTAAEISKGPAKPSGQGWIKRWDIENGKQVDVWVKPNAAAGYWLQKEKEELGKEKTSYEKKADIAKSFVDLAPSFSSLKTLDDRIKSDDDKAPIAGANELLSALKRKEVATLFASGEAWQKPELIQASIAQAGPEAQALWTDLSSFVQRILKAESGAAVTPQEAARIKEKLGAYAFSNPQTLKQGIKNAKREFMQIIQTKEAPLIKGGQATPDLIDFRKAPGAISSDDPLFDTFKTKKKKQEGFELDNL